MARKKKNYLGVLLGLFGAMLALVIVGICCFSVSFTNGPEYSLKMAAEAKREHDYAKFEKYVNVDSILDKGCDSIIRLAVEETPELQGNDMDSYLARGLTAGFLGVMKPIAVEALKQCIIEQFEEEERAERARKRQQYRVNTASIMENTGADKAEFVKIAYTEIKDNVAYVGVTLNNSETGKESVLEIKMRKIGDDTWQAVEIMNLDEWIRDFNSTSRRI